MENADIINYHICFYSQWHCGSGTSAGADIDALVIKDKNGMPYIPGKTLKGLVREAVDNLVQYEGKAEELQTLLDEAFGVEGKVTGCLHFSNAVLAEREYDAIVSSKAQEYLYNKVTTTAIGDDGTAVEHSLRSMETVVPCTLNARVTDVPAELRETIARAMGLIKRLGQKRNRGLGRCDVKEGGAQ